MFRVVAGEKEDGDPVIYEFIYPNESRYAVYNSATLVGIYCSKEEAYAVASELMA